MDHHLLRCRYSRPTPSALIASEAARRLDCGDLVEIEIKDGLQGVAGGAIAGGFGKRFEPVAVLVLQRDELGDGVMPALWPAAAIGWPTIANDGCGWVAAAIARLTLGAGERLLAEGFARVMVKIKADQQGGPPPPADINRNGWPTSIGMPGWATSLESAARGRANSCSRAARAR